MKSLAVRLLPVVLVVGIGLGIGMLLGQSARQSRNVSEAAEKEHRTTPEDEATESKLCQSPEAKPERHGLVIGLKRDVLDEYVDLHKPENVWPGITQLLRDCNITNYSIYLGELNDGNLYLFAYFEYCGDDFDADMQKMAASPVMKDWWELTDPMQIPQKARKEDEHWMDMEEVFHMD